MTSTVADPELSPLQTTESIFVILTDGNPLIVTDCIDVFVQIPAASVEYVTS